MTHLDNHASYAISITGFAFFAPTREMTTAAARAEEAASYLLARTGRGSTSGDNDDDEAAIDEPVTAPFAIAA